MYLIVGLGNPGEKYKLNRHNVGFMFIDALAKKLEVNKFESSKHGKAEYASITTPKGKKVELVKPQTFMNDSGFAVKYAKGKHKELKIEDIHVVHDDLDIPLGESKMQLAVGPKVHNGVRDIEEKLKSKNFWRLRIGVDNRDPNNRIPGEAYVLQNFNKDELEIVHRVIDDLVDQLIAYFHQ